MEKKLVYISTIILLNLCFYTFSAQVDDVPIIVHPVQFLEYILNPSNKYNISSHQQVKFSHPLQYAPTQKKFANNLETADYFPLAEGNKWTFRYSYLDIVIDTVTATIISAKVPDFIFNGDVFMMEMKSSLVSYFLKDFSDDRFFGADETKVYWMGAKISLKYGDYKFSYKITYTPPVVMIDYPLEVGKSWSTTTQIFYSLDYGFGTYEYPSMLGITVEGQVVAKETITVPAGTFECYKIQYTIKYSQYAGFGYQTTYSWWFAPNVGLVQEAVSSLYTDYEIITYQLVDYSIKSTRTYGGLTISGSVVQPTGEPILPAVVKAIKDGSIVNSAVVSNGNYVISNLSPGEYLVEAAISVDTKWTSVAYQNASAGSTNVNFQISTVIKPSVVEGKVVGITNYNKFQSIGSLRASEFLMDDYFVEILYNGKQIAYVPVGPNGEFQLKGLLPGYYTAHVRQGDKKGADVHFKIVEGQNINRLLLTMESEKLPESKAYIYPNPVKDGKCTVKFDLYFSQPEIEIKLFNIAGELVYTASPDEIKLIQSPATYAFEWKCENNSQQKVASGVYICLIKAKDKLTGETGKIVRKVAVIR